MFLTEVLTAAGTGGVVQQPVEAPEAKKLVVAPPAPNPFNPQTTIRCEVPHDGQLEVRVYNVRGRKVATVFDLQAANYGIDRGLGGDNVAASFDDDQPYTPAWQERITGERVKRVTKLRLSPGKFARPPPEGLVAMMAMVSSILPHSSPWQPG